MYSDHASGSGYDMIVGTVCIHVSTYCMKSGFGVSPEHTGIQVNSPLSTIHVDTCISRPHGPPACTRVDSSMYTRYHGLTGRS
jgi:hypothetical protein